MYSETHRFPPCSPKYQPELDGKARVTGYENEDRRDGMGKGGKSQEKQDGAQGETVKAGMKGRVEDALSSSWLLVQIENEVSNMLSSVCWSEKNQESHKWQSQEYYMRNQGAKTYMGILYIDVARKGGSETRQERM